MSLSTLKAMNDSIDASFADASDNPTVQGRRISWPGGPAIKQWFSLPESVIYYIAMNPENPEVYNKLIQTCKYFFDANPILVAANTTEKSICSRKRCYRLGHGKCCVKIDINKITSKIWLTNSLRVEQNIIPNFAALLRPKIYRCDIVTLKIFDGVTKFDNFKIFALFAKEFYLDEVTMVTNNDVPVMLENILEELPNVEKFAFSFKENTSMVSASTFKNISKLKNLGCCKNLKKLDFWNLPELDDIFTCIKDQSDIKFHLDFADNVSEEYKNRLDHLTDSLIESKLSNCYIFYRGRNEKKNDILWKLSRFGWK